MTFSIVFSVIAASFLWSTQNRFPLWTGERGTNWLDGGVAFYDTYKTKDNKYVSVGSLEPQFYSHLLKGIDNIFKQCDYNHLDHPLF